MKKLFFMLIAMSAILITSCGEDEGLINFGEDLHSGPEYINNEYSIVLMNDTAYISRCFLDQEKVELPGKVKVLGKVYPVAGLFIVPPAVWSGHGSADIFTHSESIKTIVIPNSFKRLETFDLPELTTVKIGTGAQYFYFLSFISKKIENITIDKNNPHFMTKDNVVFTKDGKELVYFPTAKGGKYTIPEGVTTMQRQCIWRNDHITELTIPESIVSIDCMAIYDCSQLRDIVNLAKTPQTIVGTYPQTFQPLMQEEATLHVPAGCKEAYKSAPYWHYFTNIVEDAN